MTSAKLRNTLLANFDSTSVLSTNVTSFCMLGLKHTLKNKLDANRVIPGTLQNKFCPKWIELDVRHLDFLMSAVKFSTFALKSFSACSARSLFMWNKSASKHFYKLLLKYRVPTFTAIPAQLLYYQSV